MPYIESNRANLKRRHCVIDATSEAHFLNFYESTLSNYRRAYGNEFCVVVNCSNRCDNAFILPLADVEWMFKREYLQGSRWVGNILRESLRISLAPKPALEMIIADYHNAFDLLQDAPQPIPARIDYE